MAPPPLPLALLLLIQLVAATASSIGDFIPFSDRLPGWKGETFNEAEHIARVQGEKAASEEKDRGAWVEVLSWKEPRALIYHNLLTDAEVEHLKGLVRDKMRPSMVVDSVTGQSKFDSIRTSNNGYLRRGQDAIVHQIEEKLARFAMIPVENGEDIQVLSYKDGQKYDAHHDIGELNTKSGQALAAEGGQRVATALMYLSDVEEGGETVFPLTDWAKDDPRAKGPWTECGSMGVAVRPHKGDVLLFFSVNMYGDLEPASMHAACPVFKGEKWTATKWIHQSSFRGPKEEKKFRGDEEGCEDKHLYCKMWGATGECQKNPGFMMGEGGSCRYSCKACPSQLRNAKAGAEPAKLGVPAEATPVGSRSMLRAGGAGAGTRRLLQAHLRGDEGIMVTHEAYGM